MIYIGQGDVTLTRIGDTETTSGGENLTLANGSQSGHSHVLRGGIRNGDQIDVPQDTQIVVEGQPWRHTPLDVPRGMYRMAGQIEYTPAATVAAED